MTKLTENAMAGTRPICPNLLKHYQLSAQEKQKYLETPEALFLFDGLPGRLAGILRDGFLQGALGENVRGWSKVIEHFMTNSQIIPALAENPGTFTMLEKMYHFEPVQGVIDNYFLQSKAGGQALWNRYQIVTAKASEQVMEVISDQGHCLMIDIGSGPGRNGIDLCRQHPNVNGKLKIECIDIDPEAIIKGQSLVSEFGVEYLEFVPKSMAKLHDRYQHTVDYGLLIGILCGLTKPERVNLLSNIRPYFRKGGRLMAASLLRQMATDDLLCAYILRETAGWQLQYPELGELKMCFEEAGWIYDGYFREEPTQFYEIGVGIAP